MEKKEAISLTKKEDKLWKHYEEKNHSWTWWFLRLLRNTDSYENDGILIWKTCDKLKKYLKYTRNFQALVHKHNSHMVILLNAGHIQIPVTPVAC